MIFRRYLNLAAIVLLLAFGWTPAIHSTLAGPPSQELLAELWNEPAPDRDLFLGVGGQRLSPDLQTLFRIIEVDDRGFSRGSTVVDSRKRLWNAKLPPEAFSEVTASRILWGVGYHQPPVCLVQQWSADAGSGPAPQLPARFRERQPDLAGPDARGGWSYCRHPFVGTRALAGLLALQVMLGNSDLKDSNNEVYRRSRPVDGALTDAQWQDAFRAGGYEPALAARFSHRMKEKIAEGLALTG